MHIIKNKSYEGEDKEELDFVSLNSKGTLSIVMKNGTHYNFIKEEKEKLIRFIREILNGHRI